MLSLGLHLPQHPLGKGTGALGLLVIHKGGLDDLAAFADKLEQACFTTLNQGTMTKDLAGLVDEGFTAHAVTSAQFIAAIRQNLEAAL